MGMLQRDRVFLNDYVNFSFMNHLTVACALAHAVSVPEEAATAVCSLADGVDAATATQRVKQNNDTPRIQKIAIARLYGELAATLEDLGAFCDAVRNRTPGEGIFRRYLRSMNAAACAALDYALSNPKANLEALLNLPALAALQGNVPAQLCRDLAADYTHLAKNIHAIAKVYRTVSAGFQYQPVPTNPHPSWQDDVNVVVDLLDSGENPPAARGGTMTQIYNKIKHRFMVIEEFQGLVQVTDTPGQILYGNHGVSSTSVEATIQSIRAAVLTTCELAALLIALDGHGVNL
jgi:hypothetical protein